MTKEQLAKLAVDSWPVVAIFTAVYFLSRFGDRIDEKILKVGRAPSRLIAKCAAWICCALVLAFAAYSVSIIGLDIINGVLLALGAMQGWLMFTRRHVAAFRIAGTEIFIAVIGCFFYLYGGPGPGRLAPPIPFAIAFWVWLLCGSTLAAVAWFCLVAAKEIKRNDV